MNLLWIHLLKIYLWGYAWVLVGLELHKLVLESKLFIFVLLWARALLTSRKLFGFDLVQEISKLSRHVSLLTNRMGAHAWTVISPVIVEALRRIQHILILVKSFIPWEHLMRLHLIYRRQSSHKKFLVWQCLHHIYWNYIFKLQGFWVCSCFLLVFILFLDGFQPLFSVSIPFKLQEPVGNLAELLRLLRLAPIFAAVRLDFGSTFYDFKCFIVFFYADWGIFQFVFIHSFYGFRHMLKQLRIIIRLSNISVTFFSFLYHFLEKEIVGRTHMIMFIRLYALSCVRNINIKFGVHIV